MADWYIHGRVQVEVEESFRRKGEDSSVQALHGILVEIHASTNRNGGWTLLTREVRTTESGYFLFEYDAPDEPTRFRVRVYFVDALLKVTNDRGPNRPAWPVPGVPRVLILRDDEFRAHRQDSSGKLIVSFGKLIFRDGEPFDLGRKNTIRRAEFWYAVKHVQIALAERDSWLAFKKQLWVIYPSNLFTWAGPGSIVRITKNPKYDDIDTLLHEVMHVWNYQHNKGMTTWIFAWVTCGTHTNRETKAVAFHEAFASWASGELCGLLFQLEGHYRPRHKQHLVTEGDLDTMHHFEKFGDAVITALRLLTVPEPYKLLFGTRDTPPDGATGFGAVSMSDEEYASLRCPADPDLGFWHILLSMQANGDMGEEWSTDWQVGKTSYGIRRFYERLCAYSEYHADTDDLHFDQETKDRFLRVLDPASSEELRDSCRDSRDMSWKRSDGPPTRRRPRAQDQKSRTRKASKKRRRRKRRPKST